jgi:hypothetical protein
MMSHSTLCFVDVNTVVRNVRFADCKEIIEDCTTISTTRVVAN